MFTMRHAIVVLSLFAIGVVGGCRDTDLKETPCIPGDHRTCSCSETTGSQICADDGQSWASCVCPEDGGVEEGGAEDSGADGMSDAETSSIDVATVDGPLSVDLARQDSIVPDVVPFE